jgi:hypothetical protein
VVDCDKVQENMVCAVGENARNGEKLRKIIDRDTKAKQMK